MEPSQNYPSTSIEMMPKSSEEEAYSSSNETILKIIFLKDIITNKIIFLKILIIQTSNLKILLIILISPIQLIQLNPIQLIQLNLIQLIQLNLIQLIQLNLIQLIQLSPILLLLLLQYVQKYC